MTKPTPSVPYPRIAMLWATVRGEDLETSYARHDLVLVGPGSLGLTPDREPAGLADGFTPASIQTAQSRVKELRRINSRAVLLCEVNFYEYRDDWLPEDHPWWLRKNGEREQFWPGTHRMDWDNKDFVAHVVRQTQALMQTGIDGIFYDNLRAEPEPWTALMQGVRAAVGDQCLILVNAGYDIDGFDYLLPYINGIMYESGWSHQRTEWEECIRAMQHNQSLLRTPRISVIERFEDISSHAGWPTNPRRREVPKRDPAARRWSLCYSLIIGDYYYLFSDSTSHRHDWYPEYDMKLGQPVEAGKRLNSHVWERRYEGGLVVVNLPGAAQDYRVQTTQVMRNMFTGGEGKEFRLPPGEGGIFVTN